MGTTNFGKVELEEVAKISTADVAHTTNADAAVAGATTTEFNTLVDLVNELKTKLNEICKG